MTFVCLGLQYCSVFAINIPPLFLRDMSANLYVNGMIIGSAEIFGTILTFFTLLYCERKKALYVSWLVCTVFSLMVFVFFPCVDKSECGPMEKLAQTVGIFVYRFFATIIFNTLSTALTELYPSQVKAIALQFLSIGNNLTYVTVPPLQTFLENAEVSVIISLVFVAFGGFCLTCGIRETFGVDPPEMIEELQYEQRQVVAVDGPPLKPAPE